MITRQRGLALVFGLVVLLLLLRHTTTPSDSPAWGSARTRLRDSLTTSTDAQPISDTDARPDQLSAPHAQQKPLTDIATLPLRQRLSYYFPYDAASPKFPGYIWQTWKTTPASADFRDEYRVMEASWTGLHPGFVHEVLTDDNARYVLRHLYSAVPDVIAAYEALPRAVLKADFFRYLILLARGGIYTDMDTMALKSTVDWVPPHVPRSTYGLVVGIEADPDRPDWAEWYSRRIQFCQWTIQAKAGHPVLVDIVAHITDATLARHRAGTLLSHDDVHRVVEFTGPALWTDALFAYFNNPTYFRMSPDAQAAAQRVRDSSDSSDSSGGGTGGGGTGGQDGFAGRAAERDDLVNATLITWRDFTGMTAAKKVGDVVVLPITCFSPGIETMGAGGDEDPMAMVKHYFDGTWKPENERHIGEVGY